MRRLIVNLMLGLALTVAGRARGAEPEASPRLRLVVAEDFEEWQWIPITHSMMQHGRKALAEGRKLSYECRGPLFRTLVGFALPTGRLVEGEEGYQGRSILLHSDDHISLGVHSHKYRDTLAQGAEYLYEIALRGRGAFECQIWLNGADPRTGKTQLKIHRAFTITVAQSWKVHRGAFRVPKYRDTAFVYESRGKPVFHVSPGRRVYVDGLRIWAKKPLAHD